MIIHIGIPACIHEQGCRSNQEDSIFPDEGTATDADRLFIVCDGMGGHNCGEVASQTICNVLSEYIRNHWDGKVFTDQLLHDALHNAIYHLNKLDDGTPRKPGTTMALLCFHQAGALAAHIGDSRIYHVRPSEQRILYKSRDHSLAYDLFLAGEISQKEMATYNKKNVLTRALLPNQEREPKVDIVHITDINPDDFFLLCSDGILEKLNNEELLDILCSTPSEKKICEMIRLATTNNADNHSAYIIRIDNVEAKESDDQYINDETDARCNAILLERQQEEEVQTSVVQKCMSKVLSWLKNNIAHLW